MQLTMPGALVPLCGTMGPIGLARERTQEKALVAGVVSGHGVMVEASQYTSGASYVSHLVVCLRLSVPHHYEGLEDIKSRA